MPFKPHIIRPEEPPLDQGGELILPDDLAELASQLSADASHLASVYPSSPHAPREEVHHAVHDEYASHHTHLRRSSWRLARAVALVAACVGLAVGINLWWHRSGEPRPFGEFAEAPAGIAETPVSVVEKPPPEEATAVRPVVPLPGPPAAASPSMFLHEYSGPELEGLYDLIDDPQEETISI